jgi:hypothetical protein
MPLPRRHRIRIYPVRYLAHVRLSRRICWKRRLRRPRVSGELPPHSPRPPAAAASDWSWARPPPPTSANGLVACVTCGGAADLLLRSAAGASRRADVDHGDRTRQPCFVSPKGQSVSDEMAARDAASLALTRVRIARICGVIQSKDNARSAILVSGRMRPRL